MTTTFVRQKAKINPFFRGFEEKKLLHFNMFICIQYNAKTILIFFSIEAYQVAETLEEELDFEGRFSANRLEQETEKTQKWRRTGAIKLSKDYRDVL